MWSTRSCPLLWVSPVTVINDEISYLNDKFRMETSPIFSYVRTDEDKLEFNMATQSTDPESLHSLVLTWLHSYLKAMSQVTKLDIRSFINFRIFNA